MKMRQTLSDQWWLTISTGEKDFLRLLMTLIRGAKNSRSREVASAARRWESGLACFIKTRLKNRRKPEGRSPKAEGRPKSEILKS